jgi:hypothetical protein
MAKSAIGPSIDKRLNDLVTFQVAALARLDELTVLRQTQEAHHAEVLTRLATLEQRVSALEIKAPTTPPPCASLSDLAAVHARLQGLEDTQSSIVYGFGAWRKGLRQIACAC